MDCVIKSSNRAYMLDWCIRSVKERAGDSIDKIFIADDATPSKYLDEILRKHPEVVILHSGRTIPDPDDLTSGSTESMEPVFNCWREAVKRCSGDYLLLLEDDIALSRGINFRSLELQLRENRVLHYKLVEWNKHFDRLNGPADDGSGETSFYGRPQFLDRASRSLMFRFLLLQEFGNSTTGFQIWRAARALRLHPRDQWVLNYQVYSLAGVVISRSWWLQLWHRRQVVFSERPQMELALKSMLKDQSLQTGYLEHPALTKSYRSAARNNLWSEQLDFSVEKMNKTLNDAWLRGELSIDLDSHDLDEGLVLELFKDEGLPEEFGARWRAWCQKIANNLTALGF